MALAKSSAFEVVPLSNHVGAEIRGLDLSVKPDAETEAALYQAWLDYLVLIFPDQKLEQEDLLRVTGYFGEINHVHRPPKFFPAGFSKILPNILMISNIRENGEAIGALPDGEMTFHHDMIHAEVPSKATILYAVEIPEVGGDTLFASGYAAYDALEPQLRDRLEGRTATHMYNFGSMQRGDAYGTGAVAEMKHPIFRTHEDTKRKALYVNRLMTTEIEGLQKAENDEILGQLFDLAERPEFVYTHKWRVGDLLLWDNRCSMHARTDFAATARRLLLRTTVKGTVRPH